MAACKLIGLIVNPIAGMGGSVGLKGTDGDLAQQARALGALPVTPGRTRDMLSHLLEAGQILWLAGPGAMGAEALAEFGYPCTVVGSAGPATSASDTRATARAMLEQGATLIVFVGGDGTARDIVDAIGIGIPVVAVPAGVKVYSAVFAFSPRAAARLVDAWVTGAGVAEKEVLDIDEQAFRADRLDAREYGYLLVPDMPAALQPGKQGSVDSSDTQDNRLDIAAYVIEQMDDSVLYLLGPGTTVRAVAEVLGLPKTLLGVDAIAGGKLIGRDLAERDILELLSRYPQAKAIVTPLGGNGFVFGRGNKQFTPAVLRALGRSNIVIIATEHKMRQLRTLRVDTDDPDLDNQLAGYTEVIIGYKLSRVVYVEAV